VLLVVPLVGTAWLTGCTPVIGDSCTLSTDCASDGTRVCDTSEPGGFCTVLNCTGNELGSLCPDNALCVEFFPNVQGCPLDVRSPARTSISECRNTCGNDSDCRTDYFCRSPLAPPWSARILDTEQTATICLPLLVFVDGGTSSVNYGYDGSLDAVPPVCQSTGPSFDAGFPPLDAGDAGSDAASDAAEKDAATDAKRDAAADAKRDATLDAGHGDAGADAAKDGPKEGAVDGSRDAAGAAKDAASDVVHDAADAG
jgi:hypothetical protein